MLSCGELIEIQLSFQDASSLEDFPDHVSCNQHRLAFAQATYIYIRRNGFLAEWVLLVNRKQKPLFWKEQSDLVVFQDAPTTWIVMGGEQGNAGFHLQF